MPQPIQARATSALELPPAPAPAALAGAVEIPLSYYWLLLRRDRWRILAVVLVVTVAAALWATSRQKVYESTAVLRIDPAGVRVVGESAEQNSSFDSRLLITTETHVITSPAVVSKVIDELNLASVPEFSGTIPPGVSDARRSELLLRAVTDHIVLAQPLDTYLLQVSFRSYDPALAARAANALATTFLEHEYATRAAALSDSTRYMVQQSDVLRAQMERDELALATYQTTNDVSDPADKSNLYQTRLTQMNTDLSQAQSARMVLQAEAASVKNGDLDALLASPRGQTLVPLRERYLADQRELDRLSATYDIANPIYIQAKAVVDHDRDVLNTELDHVKAQVEAEYQVALDREQLVSANLDVVKKEVDDFNLRAVKYNELKASADNSAALFHDLQKEIQGATVAAGERSEDLRIVSPGQESLTPVSPRVGVWIGFAFLFSLFGGIGTTVLLGVLDKSVSSPEQVERWFHLPVVGTLPAADLRADPTALAPLLARDAGGAEKQLAGETSTRRHSAFTEAILALHSALVFGGSGDNDTLALTSAMPSEGKSTVAVNLATAFASLGRRTVLVDTDMRKPTVHRKFSIPNRVGLSDVLRGRITVNEALVHAGPNLSILPAGPSVFNPAELLHLGLEGALRDLRARFDFILLDCPPVLGFADTCNVSSLAGRVLIVAYAGRTERGNLTAALRQLASVGANVAGLVLNHVSVSLGHYYGYYSHSGYKYYSREDKQDASS